MRSYLHLHSFPCEVTSRHHSGLSTRRLYLIVLSVFSSCFLLSLLTLETLTSDESAFHFPNVLNFYVNGFGALFNSQYSAANTPLPYLIVSIVAALTSPTLFIARITTFTVSLLTAFVAIRLIQLYGIPRQHAFVILFFPYFFANSFVFYVINYGLFFALTALLFLRDPDQDASLGSEFTVGVLLASAVLCQQFYLVMPLAIVSSRFVLSLRQNAGRFLPALKETSCSNLLLLVPLIVPCILFFKWGGLTHPNFRMHSIAFHPSTIVGVLFVTGFYLLPFLVQSLRDLSKGRVLASLLASTLLVILFRPTFADFQGPRVFTGLTHHLITIVGRIHPVVSILAMITLVSSGILVLAELSTHLTFRREYVLFTICILLACGYSFNTLIGERHLLGYLVILLLLVLPRIRTSLATMFSLSMSLLGICYFLYTVFIKY